MTELFKQLLIHKEFRDVITDYFELDNVCTFKSINENKVGIYSLNVNNSNRYISVDKIFYNKLEFNDIIFIDTDIQIYKRHLNIAKL